MGKPIKATDEMKAEILADVMKKLANISAFDGKFKIEVDYQYSDKDKARVSFTQMAWRKQKRLVADFYTEVGWHGVCKRDPDDPAHFIVEDIIVFPQAVTGATVTPSQEEYDLWKGMLPDEQYNNLRFHGHSHVNMDVNPSGTDTTYQKKLSDGIEGTDFTEEERQAVLEQMGDSCFYVFMIMNKSGKFWVRIRDLYYNIEYAPNEIEVVHEEEVDELAVFIADAKSKVRSASYNYGNNKGSASGSQWWNKDKNPNPNSGAVNKGTQTAIQQAQQKTHGVTSPDKHYDDNSGYPSGYWNGERWVD